MRHISQTALWAAAFRAQETLRPDALFRDSLAGRLAGKRGVEIAGALSSPSQSTAWVTRTYLFDQFIATEIASGTEMVLNLGAGLDARPYRMKLPRSLRWVEVDTAEILTYKQDLLASERACCELERIALDLRDLPARRALLAQLREGGKKTLILSEGVLIYLSPEEVSALARDLAEGGNFKRWILEVASPEVLVTMRRTVGSSLEHARASFQFGPCEGPQFFERHGWRLLEVRGVLKEAVRLGRTPIDPRFLPFIPDSPADSLPWVGVCVFTPQERA